MTSFEFVDIRGTVILYNLHGVAAAISMNNSSPLTQLCALSYPHQSSARI